MRITGLETVRLHVNHRGDWLHVRLHTDEGLTGTGEASHGGHHPARDHAVTAILRTQCAPTLVGRDPRDVVGATDALAYLVDGFAAATAVSACEHALWDLAGQAAGLPVCRMLGGPAPARIPLYANINRAVVARTPEAFATEARAAAAAGFSAVKCAPFDGMEQRRVQERAARARVRHGVACVAAIRAAVGADVEVMVDCHSAFDVPTAITVAGELHALGVRWFEEPVPTEDLDALLRVRPHVHRLGMELIGGELLFGVRGFAPYITGHLFDLVMPDVKHCGGIAPALAIAHLAAACGVAVAPHNPSGPVSMAASAHVAACLPGLRALEYAWGEVPWRAAAVTPAERIEGGSYILADEPGLGCALDPSLLAREAMD